jgi:hypothetical protein
MTDIEERFACNGDIKKRSYGSIKTAFVLPSSSSAMIKFFRFTAVELYYHEIATIS